MIEIIEKIIKKYDFSHPIINSGKNLIHPLFVLFKATIAEEYEHG